MRNERHFTQAARTIVSVNEFLEHFLPSGGASLHNAAMLKTHLYAFNHRSHVRQRFGSSHDAVGAVFVWSCEDLFCRHVGNAIVAVARSGAAAKPFVIVGESKSEVNARPTILQPRIALRI